MVATAAVSLTTTQPTPYKQLLVQPQMHIFSSMVNEKDRPEFGESSDGEEDRPGKDAAELQKRALKGHDCNGKPIVFKNRRKTDRRKPSSSEETIGYNDEKRPRKDLLERVEDQCCKIPCVKERNFEEDFEAGLSLQETESLSIHQFKEELMATIRKQQITIVQGETGSGKRTQIPQFLHEAGFTNDGKNIVCVLPNCVAAISEAIRGAEAMGVELGSEVGYSTRFDDCTSEQTVIKYMPDEMLPREMAFNFLLNSYSVIMIVAHELTPFTNLLLGMLKDIARLQPVLKWIISTDTLDADIFSDFLGEAAIFKIPGSHYPVDIVNITEPVLDYIDTCVESVLQIHATEPSGDILAFLPNQEDIEACQEKLENCARRLEFQTEELLILPLHENLPSDILKKIFKSTPPNTRKVVLATNIAESLHMIDNIMYVIDSGIDEQENIDSHYFSSVLMIVKISKVSANRRARLAGLVAPGKCFRLYTTKDYENQLKEHTVPEIKQMNLINAFLKLKSLGIKHLLQYGSLGINHLLQFVLLDCLSLETLACAFRFITALGIFDDRGQLTRTTRLCIELSVDPMMAKMLVASETYNCSEEIVTIAAMLLVNGAVLFRHKFTITDADNVRQKFNHLDGDHLSLMQVYNQWAESGYSEQWCIENCIQFRSMKRAREIRDKLVGVMQKAGIEMVSSLSNTANIRKAITAGYFYQVARLLNDGNYETLNQSHTVALDQGSTLFGQQPPFVLYHELVSTSKDTMQCVLKIDAIELLEVVPHYYKPEELIDCSYKHIPLKSVGHVDFIQEIRHEGAKDKTGISGATKTGKKKMTIAEMKKILLINQCKKNLIATIRKQQITIVQGETASGKRTPISQYLHEAGFTNNGKKIGCVLPNGVAAISLAVCAAEGMGVELGSEVGYSIPFDDCTSKRTVIKYMTDEMVLHELLSDSQLDSYSVIMIDDAHKRTLQTDILLSTIKNIAPLRPSLKIIISTSVPDADKFSNYFDGIPIFKIPDRRYPVDVFYTKEPVPDYIDACVNTVLQIHATEPSGDILAFLLDHEYILVCQKMLQDRLKQIHPKITELRILPLHANLPTNMLKKIFESTPLNTRKVILATSIAESLHTIDNIMYVIDSGLEEQKNIYSDTGLDMLMNVLISKESANRRARLAGLVAPGKCFRLYTAEDYENQLKEHTVEEFNWRNRNAKLCDHDVVFKSELHEKSALKTIVFQVREMYLLRALERIAELTTKAHNRRTEFPVDPRMAKMLVASEMYNCSEEIVPIVAMLLVNGAVFLRRKDTITDADEARKNFNHLDGDHFSMMQVYTQWAKSGYSEQWCLENYIEFLSMIQARYIRDMLVLLMQHVGIEMVSSLHNTTNIRKAITAAYFCQVAGLSNNGNYETVKHHHTVMLDQGSTLFGQQPPFVLYHKLVSMSKDTMQCVLKIDPIELLEVVPHYYRPNELTNCRYKQALLEDVEHIDFFKGIGIEGTEDKMGKSETTKSGNKKMTIEEMKKSLPIYPFKEDILTTIRDRQVMILGGETGSGKRSQIPQYLYEAGFVNNGKKIGCVLPNRVAAMSLAVCAAEGMGVELGSEVGYSTRFEVQSSERTMIKYMTDDTLLREIQTESHLDSYNVVLIDAHELTLPTNILFGLLKSIAPRRPDLKLITSTVTRDADKFLNFFGEAAIFRIPGSRYPVDIFYTKQPVLDYLDACVDYVLLINALLSSGDILVFLTGQEEIEACQEILQDRVKQINPGITELLILPLHENLPADMLKKIFESTPLNTRKVILATNIAESLHTIDNIMYVIDSGVEQQKNINPRTGLDMLMNVQISKASANRRACLAGLVAPGKCFRLYTTEMYQYELKEHTVPETKRTNLSKPVLMLKALGIENLLHFGFLDPPPRETLVFALEQLYALGALNREGKLTRTGRRMAELPVDPMMAKMLVASKIYNCSKGTVTIAAMLLVNGTVFLRRKDTITDADNAQKNFNHLDGDHLSLMQVYNQWAKSGYSELWCSKNCIQFRSMKRAREIRDKLVGIMQKAGIEMVSSLHNTTNIRKAITAGYFYHVAGLSNDGNYETVKHHHTVALDQDSTLFGQQPPFVLYHELVPSMSKDTMQCVLKIDPIELLEMVPHYYRPNELTNCRYKQALLEDIEHINFIQGIGLEGSEDKTGISETTKSEKKKMTIAEMNKSLPIYPFKQDILTTIRDRQVMIVGGETDAGKRSLIPQYLCEAGFTNNGKKIGCVLPNRVAAMSLAACAAEGMGVELGSEVGYSTSFEVQSSERTMIKYMTDDTLLREIQTESHLDSYSVVLIDAHELTLSTNTLFGLLKSIAPHRPDLKLITSTVTRDADKFLNFFGEAAIFRIPGSHYPVDIFYTKQPVPDYIDACVDYVLLIHTLLSSGDILVFLTGQLEIETCQEILQDRVKQINPGITQLLILPLHENLPADMLKKIFESTPLNTRKVILATNIAETLCTIDNIVYVIDLGFEKQKNINPRTGLDMLMNVQISKASANRRACLAGLVAPGKCFRLYTAEDYENQLKERTVPEIKRMNLSNAVLMLKALGIENLLHFGFLDPPPRQTLVFALEQLYALGALGPSGQLTRTGRFMAKFPVDPMMAKMVLTSKKYNCSEEIVTIAAMLLVNGTVFLRHKDTITDADEALKNFNHLDGDHLTLMQVYNQWAESGYNEQWCIENYIKFRSMKRARDIREKLVGLMHKVGINMVSSLPYTTNIRKAIIGGYFYHVARRSDSPNYKLVKHDQIVSIQPRSTLFAKQPRLVLYHELVFTTREFMRFVIETDPMELLEVAPHYYKLQEFIRFGRASSGEVALHEFIKFY